MPGLGDPDLVVDEFREVELDPAVFEHILDGDDECVEPAVS